MVVRENFGSDEREEPKMTNLVVIGDGPAGIPVIKPINNMCWTYRSSLFHADPCKAAAKADGGPHEGTCRQRTRPGIRT